MELHHSTVHYNREYDIIGRSFLLDTRVGFLLLLSAHLIKLLFVRENMHAMFNFAIQFKLHEPRNATQDCQAHRHGSNDGLLIHQRVIHTRQLHIVFTQFDSQCCH